ncbi:uncharacterized protein N7496_004040 [Penicillium cataractarum]|uniref:C2H2-type domain-containing protein n=1 Tax=Penicillium cataractarum TaxID=2100454 RepID=A0A9W9VH06_9EURO|nr:uncharacterized protein N7496_004040 [Penicillium cataractarum]KAJ5381612.1 hypothetical protein N7496_004040 [Penicillium cataractarum]
MSFLNFSLTFGWDIFEFEKNAGPGVHNAGLPTGPADVRSLKGFSLHLPLALEVACISRIMMPKTRSRIKRQRICPWCSLSFSKEEHLSRHIRSHTKEKPFGCVTCGKTFSRHDSLLRHSRVHSNEGKDNPILDLGAPALESYGNSDQILEAAQPLSSENDLDQVSSFPAHQATPSSLSPSQNATAAHPQARLPGWLETIVQPPRNARGQVNSQGPLFTPLDSIFDSTMEEALNFSQYTQAPTWLADEHFDLNALNSSVMASTLGFFSPEYTANEDGTDITIQIVEESHPERKEDQVRLLWFTYVGTHKSGYITPEGTQEQVELDEQYRQTLSQRLQQRVPTEPLPSTDFLNLCIQLFFTRFNPGSIIFERLNKAILASWEKYLLSGKGEAIAMTQASLIGQIFAMLSGTFHGTVATWARIYKMFKARRATDYLEAHLQTHNPEESWRTWAQSEEQVRLAAGLHILDTEISELVLTHPLLQHEESLLPLTAGHELWVASNSTQWKTIILGRQRGDSGLNQDNSNALVAGSGTLPLGTNGQPDGFQRYITLEGINARIAETRTSHATRDQTVSTQFEYQLIQFFDQHLYTKEDATANDPFCLDVLWHSAFISLLVDFDRLELAIGREGYEESLLYRDYAHQWASSPNARRCALHGAMILRKLQNSPLGKEPAIHVPRALYRAATVWYAYSEYGLDVDQSSSGTSPAVNVEFPELSRLKVNSQALLFEANGYRMSRPKTSESSTLCGLVDLLHRIGHWGLSRKFAEQLSFLLKETQS